jgi:hypothetical protein
VFAFGDTESLREGRPPIWNAFVTDDLSAVEERAGFSAAKKLLALGAAFHSEQSQASNQVVEIVLDPGHAFKQRIVSQIMWPSLREPIS